MPPNQLGQVVAQDHAALRKRLEALVSGDPDAAERDAFLDEWVAYSTGVGLVLFDHASSVLPDGEAVVERLRNQQPEFQQRFADLENADDIKAIARQVAPAFEAQLDSVMNELVVAMTEQLDDTQIASLATRYRRIRAGE